MSSKQPPRPYTRAFFRQAGASSPGSRLTGSAKAGRRQLTDEQVRDMRQQAASGRDENGLAAAFGVTPRVVRAVLKRETYGWVA